MTQGARKGDKVRQRQPATTWWALGLVAVALAGMLLIHVTRLRATAGPQEVTISEIEHVHGLAVDPSNPQVLWVGTHGSLIRVRNGMEWTRTGRQRYDMMGFNVHPTEPNVLLTSGHPGSGDQRPNPLGVEISRDGGQTWQPLALAGQADFHAMTISRADPGRLYAWNVSGRTWGLYGGRDGGRTWEVLGNRGLQQVLYLATHPQKAAVVLAGTGRGLFVSEDAGRGWRVYLSPRLLNVPVTAVEVHPKNPQIVYAYAMHADLGLIRSEDAGRQWTPVGFFLGERDAVGNLALDPTNPNILYFATFGGDLYRSADGGRTREQLVSGGKVVRAR